MTTIRMTGHDAIRYADAHSLTLCTHTDPTAEARDGVSVEDARSIAREDPSLVYLDVTIDPDRITADQARAMPSEGLTHAVDLSWRRRDDGGDWLVVERGSELGWTDPKTRTGLVSRYSRAGVIVATANSEARAKAKAKAAKRALPASRISTLYSVVRRTDVVVIVSDAPYGTTSGEASR